MNGAESPAVSSTALHDFASLMGAGETPGLGPRKGRMNLDPGDVKNGLGQLVLVLVKLLHELLEQQAIRRIESGSLTEDQVERLGITMMRQAQEIDRLRREFRLEEEDLNLDLGPLGRLF